MEMKLFKRILSAHTRIVQTDINHKTAFIVNAVKFFLSVLSKKSNTIDHHANCSQCIRNAPEVTGSSV